MKLNRKGFTLVELLVTIVIVGLVIGLSTWGIISVINNSREQAIVINKNNIKEAARIYSTEVGSGSWKNNEEYEYDAYCITIGELMNKGFLDKKASIDGGYTRDSFVIVKRNKVTLAIDSEEMVSDDINDKYNKICTGQVAKEDNIDKPVINGFDNYTDRIEISFDEGKAWESSVKDYKCLYGESSSNINREGVIERNKCILDGLKNNKNYYVFIYMNTTKGSSVLAEGEREFKTADFKNVGFQQEGAAIKITYDDTNIAGDAYHYFKSDTNGYAPYGGIKKCTVNNNNNNIGNCTENDLQIKSGFWYSDAASETYLSFPVDRTASILLNVKVCDKSGNCKDNNQTFVINKYVAKFYRNGAAAIDDKTDDYAERYCYAANGASCNITSPSITANTGYSVVGFNTSSSATSSSWNVGVSKQITSDIEYYAITKQNKVNIKYSVNGGVIASVSNSAGTWSSNNSGIVLVNGYENITAINYGESMGTNGLNDYDNPGWLNIIRTGYSAVAGEEWICLSGDCSGKTYSHAYSYSASDFCDASNSDCEVTLGVNWVDNIGPTYDRVEVTNITSSGYDVYVYGVSDPSGINRVQFPTWTIANGQDELQDNWQTSSSAAGTNQGNGTWYFRVNISDHNNESGLYNTHIYMYDNLGNCSTASENNKNVPSSAVPINTNKYVCEGTNRLAIYHVTTCTNNTCTYSTKNGLNSSYDFSLDVSGYPSWSIGANSYADSLVDPLDNSGNSCDMQTWYVNTSSLNCRTGASTSGTTVMNTFSKCAGINVYRTTMKINDSHNWFYSKTYGCYLYGQYLSRSKPSSCSTGGGGEATVSNYTYCLTNNISLCDNISSVYPIIKITSADDLPSGCKTGSTIYNDGQVVYTYLCTL